MKKIWDVIPAVIFLSFEMNIQYLNKKSLHRKKEASDHTRKLKATLDQRGYSKTRNIFLFRGYLNSFCSSSQDTFLHQLNL